MQEIIEIGELKAAALVLPEFVGVAEVGGSEDIAVRGRLEGEQGFAGPEHGCGKATRDSATPFGIPYGVLPTW